MINEICPQCNGIPVSIVEGYKLDGYVIQKICTLCHGIVRNSVESNEICVYCSKKIDNKICERILYCGIQYEEFQGKKMNMPVMEANAVIEQQNTL